MMVSAKDDMGERWKREERRRLTLHDDGVGMDGGVMSGDEW
jgi:hypothetical protein